MGHGLALCALGLMATPASMMASSHREAPITSLDQKADITDWYAFVNPQHPDRVVFIMNVDPFLEPSNGPNYFPFDPNLLYEMKVDNNFDGKTDISFQFRFTTEVQLPGVFTGLVGGLAGIPQILDLTGPRSAGLSLRQHYSVNMVSANGTLDLTGGQTLYALPTNVGPRTMPQYGQLAQKAIYNLPNFVTVFAGTVADPFFVDLGAAFDSLNFRTNAGGGVLPPGIDGDDAHNYAPNAVAGFNVNSIVLSVPIQLLTQDGKLHVASDKLAVIGTWATTSRQQMPVLSSGITAGAGTGNWTQVQRLGNPLINELIIGTGSKDMFSVSEPYNDSQFASFFLNPLLATIFSSIGIPVPSGQRTDLLPLVQYAAPICPGCAKGDAGPVADLLRLNTGIAPAGTKPKRLGFLAGDLNGFPNGRRLEDDVIDIAARAVAGILADPVKYNTPIGDGVNMPSVPFQPNFPFEALAYSGRDSVHQGPGQTGCATLPGQICPGQ